MPLWCVAKQIFFSEAKLPSHCRNIGQCVTDKLLKVANYSAARVSAHLANTTTFSTELVLLDHCFPYILFFLTHTHTHILQISIYIYLSICLSVFSLNAVIHRGFQFSCANYAVLSFIGGI